MEEANLAKERMIHDVERLLQVYLKSPTPAHLDRITERLLAEGFANVGRRYYGSMERQNASYGRVYTVDLPLTHDQYLSFQKTDYPDDYDVGSEEDIRRMRDLVYNMQVLSAFVYDMKSFDLRTIKRMVEDPDIDPKLIRIPRKGVEPAFERWIFDTVRRHKELVVHLKTARGTRRKGIPQLSVEGPISDAVVRYSIIPRSKVRKFFLEAFRILDLQPAALSKKRKASD